MIVPTCNRERLLRETLESVERQTFPDFECLVADDGSTDGTRDVVEGFTRRDARFRHLPLAHCGKHGRVRNLALGEARAPLVAFLDDDDLWLPETLGTQVAALETEQATALVFGQMERFGAAHGVWPRRVPAALDLPRLLRGNVIALSTVLARLEALLGAGLFPEDVEATPDYELWLRVARLGPIRGLPRVLCRYRVHAGNMSRRKALELDELESLYARLQAEWSLPDSLLSAARRGIERGRARLAATPLEALRHRLRAVTR